MRLRDLLVSTVCPLALIGQSFAATAPNYHAVPASKEVAAYVVPAAAEPKLSPAQTIAALRKRVKYVFVIYQENRSFDSYFGTFPGADGLFSRPAAETAGFDQPIVNVDGSKGVVHPFRIGPKEFASDTDDIDHSHSLTVKKMHVALGDPAMDGFATTEETKYSPSGNPSLMAKQFGELAMAYEDCDTIPVLWRYADRFTLFDHVFEEMTGPSTPGNLSIISAQTGVTQWALHPDQAFKGNGDKGPGVPVLNDADPFWGSQDDKSAHKMPVNPGDFKGNPPKEYATQRNLTFASLPLTTKGGDAAKVTAKDSDPKGDLVDVQGDVKALAASGARRVPFGWYEEGYDKEHSKSDDDGPTDAMGTHASYIAHHNGPQYFGYVANNPAMLQEQHGLGDFFADIDGRKLSPAGGVFFVKGGYENTLGLKPADPDPAVQKNFIGDDDHPGYSDSQISQAMVATAIDKIAASPYWKDSAIVITWDDSEGDYDHVKPPVRARGPNGEILTEGPRVPLLVISPYAKTHYVSHERGSQSSVPKMVDAVFGLTPMATLPDELRARELGKRRFGLANMGPDDAITPGVSDLLDAFDPARLSGKAAPLPASYVMTPKALYDPMPQTSGAGCKTIGILPVDYALGIKNDMPADFNPRPKTNPTPVPATK
ncbi:MAG: hypothetical protein KGI57_01955 [Hyphomicrobiales bacterium]|nr:hypothetical protein [Hyphomicrobiales bacterium]MDE2016451.1 hypothetical protein [Hyphomicrobiales bacterium]